MSIGAVLDETWTLFPWSSASTIAQAAVAPFSAIAITYVRLRDGSAGHPTAADA